MLLNGKTPPPLIALTAVEEKEMEWLWFPYIPARDATMVYGPGGIGKSHIVMDIAARVSTGEPFPFQDIRRPAEKVLLLSAEDDPGYVLKPRLRRAGANMENIFIPPVFFTVDQKGIELIDYYIENVSLGLVFIDPVVAYIGSKVDINKANEVRGFVGGLQNIAKIHGIPIVYVHHTRKGGEGREQDRAMGSADFVNGSRSSLYVTRAPNGDKIMQHAKVNYAAEGPSLSFAFDDDGFHWTGIYQADGTLASGGKKRNDAASWIKQQLEGGPVAASEIEKRANSQGFNHRTLLRAKTGVAESYMISVNGKLQWYWRLKETANGVDKADVPVMGDKWGLEGSGIGRVEREIHAREADGFRKPARSVAVGRLGQTADGSNADKRALSAGEIDDLMDQVLK